VSGVVVKEVSQSYNMQNRDLLNLEKLMGNHLTDEEQHSRQWEQEDKARQ